MGLIIGNKIQKLMTGYPTVSDKYNVAGAINGGTTNIAFGDPVMLISTSQNSDGYYVKKATSTVTADNFAGFAVATNVKTPLAYPGTTTEFAPGEALGILVNGYIAVDFGAATENTLLPGKKLYITAAGVLSLSATNNIDTGYVLTGVYEDHGTSSAHKFIAEVCKA